MKTAGHLKTVALITAGLMTAAALHAQPQVKTIAGGPKSAPPATYNNLNPYGYHDGQTFTNAQFNLPAAIAISTDGNVMYVADRTNNAIRYVTMPADAATSQTYTFAATNNISSPVDIAVDGANNLYILNRGNGNNGSVVKYNQYQNFLGILATNLTNATAFALDGSTNIYITLNTSNVMRVVTAATNAVVPASTNIVGVITNSGSTLKGVAVLDNGVLALSDANPTNSGVWLLNPINGSKSILTGFNGTNETFGTAQFATLNQPEKIAKAGGGVLVIADRMNQRVKVITPAGTVTNLYGIKSNCWTTITYPSFTVTGWIDGPGSLPVQDYNCNVDIVAHAESREPIAVTVAANGDVYAIEAYYHLIRKVTSTGLTGPGGVNNAGGNNNGTNTNSTVTVATPSINPSSGYFPMGQTISVNSSVPTVYYTIDGSTPTTNSRAVTMNGNIGSFIWNNPTNDLTSLRLAAFIGNTSSTVVSGQSAATNSIGVPTGRYANILAGIGSTILVPVVANIRTNDTVKSFDFRVEITPNNGAPALATGFSGLSALSISSNDFVKVITAAQGGADAAYLATPYTSNSTQGLKIQADGSQANVSFQYYAVVAMLTVSIPSTATNGQSYTIQVTYPSATSDANQTPVAFNAAPPTTILITNVSYIVGDVAQSGWYNAGDFGDGNLANNDVNAVFYASAGLRVPDAFSDAFDAMDSFPVDQNGFVGGDGQIRFLDWQVTSDRSLRLNTNNWQRSWSTGGVRANNSATLVIPPLPAPPLPAPPGQIWYRQAAVGSPSGINGPAGSTVSVPVYVRVINGANLTGLEFRAVIMPDNSAPANTQPLQFTAAAGLPSPIIGANLNLNQIAVGWPLGSFDFASQSSNLLGYIQVPLPANALAGQTYTVTFANADGAPDLYTPYDFETRRTVLRVGNAPAPTPDGISDEWKIYFFGSVSNPNAAANADPDGDGSPNSQEYLNGTDPTNPNSCLKLAPAPTQPNQLPLRWLSAPGKVYSVDRSSSLGSSAWNSAGTFVGDGYQKTFLETNLTGNAMFYRVRVISAP